ncbi:MAG: MBOAT family protein [Clostridiaceae bacterium]|nr:MBOAT family protein [Clostridiaceae bacterium]
MLFNSLEYLIFYPVITILYFILPHKARWALLLAGSLYFYMAWKPEYVILMLASISISYITGLKMGSIGQKEKRKKYLYLSLFVNLGLLAAFKYFNFFNESARLLFNRLNIQYNVPGLDVLLPMGISFYTFQALSYSIDVYRGRIKPEKHFGIFALYVSFFPQLVAGPIERADRLLPQFYNENKFDYDRVTAGLKIMAGGFFKKVVVADRLGVAVSAIYNSPAEHNSIQFILATVFFAFQIFYDFSGYSDIAIGSAKVMGIDLMKNFDRPYFSKSIAEFWRRWHISLSTWFKDYLYIPLGGNRVSKLRNYFNLFVTFLISGLWHGANWTFLVWGALHGAFSVTGRALSPLKQKAAGITRLYKLPSIYNAVRVLFTFSLVSFAWIFFRANTISDALYIVSHLFSDLGKSTNFQYLATSVSSMGLTKFQLTITILGIIAIESVHLLERKRDMVEWLSSKPVIIRWGIYSILVTVTFWLAFSETKQFIYFQF